MVNIIHTTYNYIAMALVYVRSFQRVAYGLVAFQIRVASSYMAA